MWRSVLIAFGLFLIILSALPSWGQANKKFRSTDSSFFRPRIVDFKHQFAVTTFLAARNLSILIRPELSNKLHKDSLREIEYQPNARQQLGLGLIYKNVSVSVGLLKIADPNRNKDRFGSTRYTDVNVQALGNSFAIEALYKSFSGFAQIPNPETEKNKKFRPNIRPDIALRYIKLKGLYITSPNKFSYRAAINCTQKHVRSGGSWAFVAHTYYFQTKSDSALVPSEVQKRLLVDIPDRGITAVGSGLGAGRAQVFVYKGFYTALVLSVGLDAQIKSANLLRIAPLFDMRLATGYAAKRFFVVATLINDYTFLNGERFKAQVEYRNFSLDFGYRFLAPKILRQQKFI